MSGKYSRDKGARFERKICQLMQPIVDKVMLDRAPKLVRNTIQYAKGGVDIEGLSWIAIECKDDKSMAKDAWWRQTVKQCSKDQVPVLIYKERRQIRVRMMYMINRDYVLVDISFNDWLKWFEFELLCVDGG